MELEIKQHIYYSNKKWVPLKEVAESLLALESLIKQSPDILEALFPGTKISSVEVYIDELKSDSIEEEFFIKFIFGSQKGFDEFIANARERMGIEKIMDNPKLFAAILLVMILTGGSYYLGKDASAKPSNKATIEANNNTIINIGAGMVDMSAEDFRTLVEGAIKDKDKLAKNAIKVVKPAKKDAQATITFSDTEELRISNESVKAMPQYVQEPEPQETMKDFKDITIEVRAADLDSTKKGWAAVVPSISDKRVKLQIDPSINTQQLLEQRIVQADITVVFVRNTENETYPKLVFLRELLK